MLRLATIFILLLLASPNAISQWADWERLPGPTGGMINSFAEVGGDIVAAPNGGAFYRSTDGGASWAFLYEAAWTRNTSVLHGAADGMLYALGYSGSYRSSDRGQSWTKCSPGDMALYVATTSDGTVLFGMRGAIAVSTDQGASWTQSVPLQGAARDYKVAVDLAGNWYAGAYQTGVFRSTDQGTSWESIDAGLPNNVVYSVSVPAGDAVYVGLNNVTYRSSDRGDTWEEVSDLFGMNTFSVQHAGGNVLIATTTQGNWISTDFGVSWSHGSFATHPSSVFVFARRNGTVLYSTAGRVLRSTDRGATFAISDEGLFVQNISAIASMWEGHMLAGCENGGMYLSTDEGETWEFVDTPAGWGYSIRKIEAHDSKSDFAANVLTGDGKILFHQFGDAGWSILDDSIGGMPFLDMHGSDGVTAVAGDGRILLKAPGNGPWEERGRVQPTSGSIAVAALTIVNDISDPLKKVWLCATDRGLYRSVDEAFTWNPVLVGGLPIWLTEIASGQYTVHPRFGVVLGLYACSADALYTSVDAGETWDKVPLDLTLPRELTFNLPGDFYFLDDDIIRFRPRPGTGSDWRVFPALPVGGATALDFVSSSIRGRLLVGTASQGILRSRSSTVSSPDIASAPAAFSITSLYPVPLSSGSELLHLRLDMRRSGAVTVEIRDLLGRVLRREEQGTLAAGSHAISLRAAGLPSSMLLLQVHGPGGTRTRMLPALSVHQ